MGPWLETVYSSVHFRWDAKCPMSIVKWSSSSLSNYFLSCWLTSLRTHTAILRPTLCLCRSYLQTKLSIATAVSGLQQVPFPGEAASKVCSATISWMPIIECKGMGHLLQRHTPVAGTLPALNILELLQKQDGCCILLQRSSPGKLTTAHTKPPADMIST